MKKLQILASAMLFSVVGSAHADLPAAATAALTSVQTSVSDTETAVWPIIGAALVAGIVIKLVKRFAGKI